MSVFLISFILIAFTASAATVHTDNFCYTGDLNISNSSYHGQSTNGGGLCSAESFSGYMTSNRSVCAWVAADGMANPTTSFSPLGKLYNLSFGMKYRIDYALYPCNTFIIGFSNQTTVAGAEPSTQFKRSYGLAFNMTSMRRELWWISSAGWYTAGNWFDPTGIGTLDCGAFTENSWQDLMFSFESDGDSYRNITVWDFGTGSGVKLCNFTSWGVSNASYSSVIDSVGLFARAYGSNYGGNNCSYSVKDFFVTNNSMEYPTIEPNPACFSQNSFISLHASIGQPICQLENQTYTLNYSGMGKVAMKVDCYGDGKQVIETDFSYSPEITCFMNVTKSYTAKIWTTTYGSLITQGTLFTTSGYVINDSYPDCYTTGMGSFDIDNPQYVAPTASDQLDVTANLANLKGALGLNNSTTLMLVSILVLIVLTFYLSKQGVSSTIIIAVDAVLLVALSVIGFLPRWLLILYILIGAAVSMILYKRVTGAGQ